MELSELARQYRETAARLDMALHQHAQKKDMPPDQIAIMRKMLEDIRLAQHTMSAYYDFPRPGIIDCSSWAAGGHRNDDN